MRKRQIWVYELHFVEVRGDHMILVDSSLESRSSTDFLFALIELFCYLLRFWSYEAKCVQFGCFHRGSTSLHASFTWTGSSPINRSWRQKTRDTGQLDRVLLDL